MPRRIPTPYQHWTGPDGTAFTLRSIGPQDARIEQEFVRGLSEESKYFRFLCELRELSPEMLEHFTHPDPDRECALIVTIPRDGSEEEIAVARYALNPDDESCEFAIVVADDWQGKGIGSRLMRSLMEHGARRGLKRMDGYILASNVRMLDFVHRLGFQSRPSAKGPTIRSVSRWLDDFAGDAS